jgi:hypothetical protein
MSNTCVICQNRVKEGKWLTHHDVPIFVCPSCYDFYGEHVAVLFGTVDLLLTTTTDSRAIELGMNLRILAESLLPPKAAIETLSSTDIQTKTSTATIKQIRYIQFLMKSAASSDVQSAVIRTLGPNWTQALSSDAAGYIIGTLKGTYTLDHMIEHIKK